MERGLRKGIIGQVKMMTNVEYCIGNKIYDIFTAVQNAEYEVVAIDDSRFYSIQKKIEELLNENEWLRLLDNTNVKELSFTEFYKTFNRLISRLCTEFEEFLQTGGLLRRIKYSTIYLPRMNYEEIRQIASNFYALKTSLTNYKILHPIRELTEVEYSCIRELKGKNNGEITTEFGSNLPPVFLIEMVRVKRGACKTYLGEQFKKGQGLDKEELKLVANTYGLTGPSSFHRKCSEYRTKPIREMLYDFSKKNYEDAILFVTHKLEDNQDFFQVSVLQEILEIYRIRFSN